MVLPGKQKSYISIHRNKIRKNKGQINFGETIMNYSKTFKIIKK